MHHGLWLVFFFEIFWSFVHATCYFPNGLEMTRPKVEFFECDSSQEHTMCCGTGDHCRSDGLCDSIFYGLVFRNGCSDSTWQSSSCVSLCDSGFLDISIWNDQVKDLSNSGVPVLICKDGSYCCGDGKIAENCCASREGFFIRNGSAIPHYAVPFSAKPVLISTVSTTVVESYTVSVTPTLSSKASIRSTTSLNSSIVSTSPGSSSANKSLVNATMGGTIGGGVVVLVLVFGSWVRLHLWWNKDYPHLMCYWDIEGWNCFFSVVYAMGIIRLGLRDLSTQSDTNKQINKYSSLTWMQPYYFVIKKLFWGEGDRLIEYIILIRICNPILQDQRGVKSYSTVQYKKIKHFRKQSTLSDSCSKN